MMTPVRTRARLSHVLPLLLLAAAACDSPSEPKNRNGAFDIEIRYFEPLTPVQQAAFEAAAAKWSSVITGDVPDVNITTGTGVTANRCGIRHPAFTGMVDDLLIFVDVDSIDGPNQQVGAGGPCFFRNGSRITVIGVMKFDRADMQIMQEQETLRNVILHEMGHVLGFSPDAWEQLGLVADPESDDPTFTGANARNRFVLAGGMSPAGVPLENTGGAGTRGAHWRETVFGAELMTGFISTGVTPLSAITLGSLADLGYQVDYSAADSYSVPVLSALRVNEPVMRINEQIIRPIGGIAP